MKRVRVFAGLFVLALVATMGSCVKSPDPWSPKTYPVELKPFTRDRGALGPAWKKYEIKGMEENSFFFGNESIGALISVYFTCGKYHDIPLERLAEFLIIPMGKKPEVVIGRYLKTGEGGVYHLVAKGVYHYHKETLYKELGLVPDLYADLMMDAYVIREPHCVVDVVYVAPPENYPAGLDDFHAYLDSLGVPADRESAVKLEAPIRSVEEKP